ncbi:pimeloyl-ACP methyl ester carboxylesterase [Methylorubrum extorquens]|nr:pimeloyl-ACP methyl ester carboxylesterase [Methylorubrum extorquens]
MPVLAVAGRQSVAGRLGSALRSKSTHLNEVLVEACGHFVAEEAPGPFHQAVRRFLSAS